jgi:hypothetical protein
MITIEGWIPRSSRGMTSTSRKMALRLGVLMSLFFLVSCTSFQKSNTGENKDSTQDYFSTSKNAKAIVPENPADDPAYSPILVKWARDVTLYKDLEMYFSGSAILMTTEMMEAYKKRAERIQGIVKKFDTNVIPEKKDILPVVVTMYTTSPQFIELDDSKIWNVALFYQNQWVQPSSIFSYRNKASLQPYFPIGSNWSRMYVVQYRIPNWQDNKSDVVFSMQSGIAKADYYWR